MQLKHIKISNIRSYSSCEVSFPKGLVLLSGDIGSGKSSILHAIEFALFGLIRGHNDGAGLLRVGTRSGSVTLQFSVQHHEVSITRSLKRSSQGIQQESGTLIVDGVSEEFTPTELRARILALLGYPLEKSSLHALLFRYTVYTPQEQMKAIISDNTDERLTILRKLFNIDKYKRAIDNQVVVRSLLRERIAVLDSEKKLLRNQCEHFEGSISRIEGLRKELVEKQSQKTLLDTQLAEAQTQLMDVQKALVSVESQLGELRAANKQKQDSEKQMQEIAARKQELARQLEQFNTASTEQTITHEQLQELDKELTEKKTLYDGALAAYEKDNAQRMSNIKQRTTLEEKIKAFNQDIEGFDAEELTVREKQQEELADNILVLQEQVTSLQRQHDLLSHREKDITEQLPRLSLKGICETCGQPINEQASAEKKHILDTELQQVLENKNNTTTELTAKQKTSVQLQQQQKQLQQIIEHIRTKKTRVEERKKQIEALRQEITNIEKQLEQKPVPLPNQQPIFVLQKQINAGRELLRKEERKKQLHIAIQQYDEQITVLQKTLESLVEKLTTFEQITKQQKALQATATTRTQVLGELQQKVTFLVSEISSHQERLSTCLEHEKQLHELKEKINICEKKQMHCEHIQNWLQTAVREMYALIERHVMVSLYREFNAVFTQWTRTLIDDEGLYVRLDADFSPVVEHNDVELSLSYLSGGERTSVALAYRLALNKVVNSSLEHIHTKELLILDEPTDGFSSEQLDKVRDVLQELDTHQLILVSHEQKVRTFVDAVIEVSKQESESSVLQD